MVKKKKGLLAVLLACAMTIGSALPASAAEPQDESQTPAVQAVNDGLELSKSISLKDNGNYELKLEAYATGQTTTTTVTEKQALDIILVLDQSGSMADPFGNSGNRQAALKNAVDNFIDAVYADSMELNEQEGDVEHRLGIVTYGSSSTILEAFGSVETNYSEYVDAIAGLPNSPSGATRADMGMEEANNMLPNETEGRKSVVVLFTDGVPTEQSSFSDNVAEAAIAEAYQMKNTKGATVYTIGIFEGAVTNYIGEIGDRWSYLSVGGYDLFGISDTQKANRFMQLASSNSLGATDLGKGTFNDTFLIFPYSYTGIANNFDCDPSRGYYKTASNAEELNDVFEEVQHESSTSGTSVTLDGDALLRDVVDTANFKLPAGMQNNNVSISVVAGTKADNDSVVVWGDEGSTQGIEVSVNSETSTVDVTGFDYATNYIAPGHPGAKLVVKFEVQALHAGTDMTSNTTASAIYTDSTAATLVKQFEVPQVTIAEKTYVLDFGKKVEVAKTGAQYVKAEPSAHGNATTYDTTDGYFAVEGSGISYQPQTTNWASVDTGYVFGNNSSNYWEADSFLPATSVYYEDDFGYTTNENGSQTKQNGYATIEYTGDWKTVTAGEDAGDTQSSVNTVYGTDAAYDGNLNYSDGSAHTATSGATAKFTFTGTGLDIYTRTTASSGQVIVQIKGQGDNGKTYTALVDNEFTSMGEDGLYQIPTVSFQDVERNTYDATITVLPDKEGNSTFYLDAIRVYNPMSEEDPTAAEAYEQAGEANAVTKEVRDELIDATTLGTVSLADITETAGSVYIDKNSESTTEIGTYEDLGPMNEVYLAPNTGIAFSIGNNGYEKVLLGLKAPEGQASKVTVTLGAGQTDIPINSATDMYYQITPTSDGNIVVYNSGEAMIVVTKLRVTGVTDAQSLSLMTTPALMSYVETFDSLEYVESVQEPEEDTEEPVVENPDENTGDAVVENPEENTGDVVIENPEVPQIPEEPDTEQDSQKDFLSEAVNALWNSIWNGFSSLFGRW